jgi:hypothetical protein
VSSAFDRPIKRRTPGKSLLSDVFGEHTYIPRAIPTQINTFARFVRLDLLAIYKRPDVNRSGYKRHVSARDVHRRISTNYIHFLNECRELQNPLSRLPVWHGVSHTSYGSWFLAQTNIICSRTSKTRCDGQHPCGSVCASYEPINSSLTYLLVLCQKEGL